MGGGGGVYKNQIIHLGQVCTRVCVCVYIIIIKY